MITRNAKIVEATLGFERGIFTSFIRLELEGTTQLFGGRALAGDYTNFWIKGILGIVGKDWWSQVPGCFVRVSHDHDGLDAEVVRVGHIIHDIWFDPRAKWEGKK
jgi:hypothetical protein